MFDLLKIPEYKNQNSIYGFQDNTSTITVAYMGRPSLQSRRHFVDIRYFWFRQYLESKFALLEYLASEDMVADFFASIRSGGDFLRPKGLLMSSI